MTLILSNEEIDGVLNMADCIAALEQAYRDQAACQAVNRPRTDIYTPHERDDAFYVFKSFEGMLPSAGVVALRINSDVITWSEYAGTTRKDKLPAADGRWVGLVLLFSISTGEPLAIFPDGVVQRMRVGAANGLAARFLAKENSQVYGLLGAGWQAGAQLMAMATVRSLREVRVYSPNPESRRHFAEEYGERLGLPIRAVDSAEEAADGADILGTATNSIGAIVQPQWLQPGMHVSCVKRSELGPALQRCQRVVVHAYGGLPMNYLVGLGDVPVASHDPTDLIWRVRRGERVDTEHVETTKAASPAFSKEPRLADLITGEARGRSNDEEITAFVNNIGLGIQFAAVGALAYNRAKERGLGHELPTSWFTENVHP